MEKKFYNSLKWWDMILAYIPIILVACGLLPKEFLLAAVPPVVHQVSQGMADLGKNKKAEAEQPTEAGAARIRNTKSVNPFKRWMQIQRPGLEGMTRQEGEMAYRNYLEDKYNAALDYQLFINNLAARTSPGAQREFLEYAEAIVESGKHNLRIFESQLRAGVWFRGYPFKQDS